jgi:hypothetical protein
MCCATRILILYNEYTFTEPNTPIQRLFNVADNDENLFKNKAWDMWRTPSHAIVARDTKHACIDVG